MKFLSITILTFIFCGIKTYSQTADVLAPAYYNEYIEMKGDFCSDDAEGAKQNATEMKQALNSSVIPDEKKLSDLNDQLTAIENGKTIDEQRKAFYAVSTEMISIMKKSPIDGKTLYVQYCPMAFNGRGAYWLSNEKEINNPYFGSKMPHCGSVDNKISN